MDTPPCSSRLRFCARLSAAEWPKTKSVRLAGAQRRRRPANSAATQKACRLNNNKKRAFNWQKAKRQRGRFGSKKLQHSACVSTAALRQQNRVLEARRRRFARALGAQTSDACRQTARARAHTRRSTRPQQKITNDCRRHRRRRLRATSARGRPMMTRIGLCTRTRARALANCAPSSCAARNRAGGVPRRAPRRRHRRRRRRHRRRAPSLAVARSPPLARSLFSASSRRSALSPPRGSFRMRAAVSRGKINARARIVAVVAAPFSGGAKAEIAARNVLVCKLQFSKSKFCLKEAEKNNL